MAHPDKKEQARLRSLYHRLGFNFEVEGHYRAEYRGRSQSLSENYNQRERELAEWHRQIATQERLMKMYPDLWIAVSEYVEGYSLFVWIKRIWPGSTEERDAEAIRHTGALYLDDPSLHQTLAAAQEQAALAKQDGWFYCTGHGRAEKREEGHWFHFAGRFCVEYGKENPQARTAAGQERYN